MSLKNRRGGLLALFAALAISVLPFAGLKASSVDVVIPNHPASHPEIEADDDEDERAEMRPATAARARK